MGTTPGIITLTTDFGLADWFVGVMKGVILSISPRSRIVDISHGVPAGDVVAGAFVLREAYSFFPEGTIHLCVVDPGVGGARAAVAVRTGRYLFVGPDNGLMSLATGDDGVAEIVSLENPRFMMEEISDTFHGRDIFAPAAAHLATGVPVGEFGSRIDAIKTLEVGDVCHGEDSVVGEVIYVDRFGNLITNIRREDIGSGRIEVEIGGGCVRGLLASYSSALPGEPLALMGSGGYLEISVNGGSAEERLGAVRGAKVRVSLVTNKNKTTENTECTE